MIKTNYFATQLQAVAHYQAQGLTATEARYLITDGTVKVGKPPTMEGEQLMKHTASGRYWIKDKTREI